MQVSHNATSNLQNKQHEAPETPWATDAMKLGAAAKSYYAPLNNSRPKSCVLFGLRGRSASSFCFDSRVIPGLLCFQGSFHSYVLSDPDMKAGLEAEKRV